MRHSDLVCGLQWMHALVATDVHLIPHELGGRSTWTRRTRTRWVVAPSHLACSDPPPARLALAPPPYNTGVYRRPARPKSFNERLCQRADFLSHTRAMKFPSEMGLLPAHQSPPTALSQKVHNCVLLRRVCSRQQGAAAESSTALARAVHVGAESALADALRGMRVCIVNRERRQVVTGVWPVRTRAMLWPATLHRYCGTAVRVEEYWLDALSKVVTLVSQLALSAITAGDAASARARAAQRHGRSTPRTVARPESRPTPATCAAASAQPFGNHQE
jgi:hypothetical protein